MFVLVIAEETRPVAACETAWTFSRVPPGQQYPKMHVQWHTPLCIQLMAFLRGFVDDNKTGGGSTFPEEVAGKTIVGNTQRKSGR